MGTQKQARSLLLCLALETFCSLGQGVAATTWDSHFDALDTSAKKMTWDGHFDALDRAAKRRSITRVLAPAEADPPILDPDAVTMEIPYLYDPRDPAEQRYGRSLVVQRPTLGGAVETSLPAAPQSPHSR